MEVLNTLITALAAIAGVTRQFANATLNDLRHRGLLILRKHDIIVTEPGLIEKLAFGEGEAEVKRPKVTETAGRPQSFSIGTGK